MKGGDLMKNNILKTLFVGIDVSSKINVLCALDFQGNKFLNLEALINQPDAESPTLPISYLLMELLLVYQPLVYCLI
jgi:hypothetical protein